MDITYFGLIIDPELEDSAAMDLEGESAPHSPYISNSVLPQKPVFTNIPITVFEPRADILIDIPASPTPDHDLLGPQSEFLLRTPCYPY